MSVGLTAIAIIGLQVSEHFTESVGRMREKEMSQEVVWWTSILFSWRHCTPTSYGCENLS